MIILIIVLLLLLCISVYIIYNLFNKVEYLTVYSGNIVQSLEIIRNRILEMNSQIRAIDKRGSFESDDEVGFFFKELQNIVDRLNILFSIVNESPLQIKDNDPNSEQDTGGI